MRAPASRTMPAAAASIPALSPGTPLDSAALAGLLRATTGDRQKEAAQQSAQPVRAWLPPGSALLRAAEALDVADSIARGDSFALVAACAAHCVEAVPAPTRAPGAATSVPSLRSPALLAAAAAEALHRAAALSTARRVYVLAHDNGLFANVLQLLDALLLAPSDASIHVDWRVARDNTDFRYGGPGADIFEQLFVLPLQGGSEEWAQSVGLAASAHSPKRQRTLQAERAAASNGALVQAGRVNPLFCSVFRGLLGSAWKAVPGLRQAYQAAWRRLGVRHPTALQELAALVSGPLKRRPGQRLIGVHKRLDCPGVRRVQTAGELASCDQFAARAIDAAGAGGGVVYLATDDVGAPDAFAASIEAANARRSPHARLELCVRRGVARSEGGELPPGVGSATRRDNEVHTRPETSLVDAVDVLVDALALAECDVIVHADSNVTTFASIVNPRAELVHVAP